MGKHLKINVMFKSKMVAFCRIYIFFKRPLDLQTVKSPFPPTTIFIFAPTRRTNSL